MGPDDITNTDSAPASKRKAAAKTPRANANNKSNSADEPNTIQPTLPQQSPPVKRQLHDASLENNANDDPNNVTASQTNTNYRYHRRPHRHRHHLRH